MCNIVRGGASEPPSSLVAPSVLTRLVGANFACPRARFVARIRRFGTLSLPISFLILNPFLLFAFFCFSPFSVSRLRPLDSETSPATAISHHVVGTISLYIDESISNFIVGIFFRHYFFSFLSPHDIRSIVDGPFMDENIGEYVTYQLVWGDMQLQYKIITLACFFNECSFVGNFWIDVMASLLNFLNFIFFFVEF